MLKKCQVSMVIHGAIHECIFPALLWEELVEHGLLVWLLICKERAHDIDMPIHGIWFVLYIRYAFKALLRALAALNLGFHDRQWMKVDASPNIEQNHKKKRTENGTHAMSTQLVSGRTWQDGNSAHARSPSRTHKVNW